MCEVVVELPDGTRYSAVLEAESVFNPAVLFYAHTAAPPPGANPPRLAVDALLEVRPIYKVCLRDAMKWANKEAQAKHRQ